MTVDATLPKIAGDNRPLRVMFLDLNAYFASVEQEERPELRGRPIAVVPVQADSTFVIAASYEAKRYGVKTGTRVGDARAMCPEIELVQARPPLYVHYHRRVLDVVETVLPIDKVCSIDEMRFRLLGKEREPAEALELARQMKTALAEHVGSCMTASIGLAPNAFLAKLATDLQKPDGLVMIQAHELPDRLRGLNLTEFAGINRRMEIRLQSAGIFRSDDLLEATPAELAKAFGSITGERWWYLLRGYEVDFEARNNQSLGHSHVLAPELRTERGARDVLLRLAQKATARLRANGFWTAGMAVTVRGKKRHWHTHTRLPPTQDSITVTEKLLELWRGHDFDVPQMVGITFTDIATSDAITPSLFEPTVDRSRLSHVVDRMNQKFGKNSVYLAGIERAKHSADEKIAFNKTWLFSEGKDDNVWPDTFRGNPRPENQETVVAPDEWDEPAT